MRFTFILEIPIAMSALEAEVVGVVIPGKGPSSEKKAAVNGHVYCIV